ncbi:MAG: tRNA (N6-isopentenyl adenosine(37)-C2)-methylthiotransferase MiaB [Victivallales bacterium]|nr:tRNA (N6-isopentenyl adenosine(37)-C2)-methylthiotransferase MiaB [Victivallales bacterium]
MNERDSEAIAAELIREGFRIVKNEYEADILIFNTCSVREQAERKAVGKVGILKRLKRENPDIFIGIIGCMAQRRGNSLLKELPHVDFIIGTEQLTEIPQIIKKEIRKREKITKIETGKELLQGLDLHINTENKVTDFVSVMRGCDMFCAYCIVPYVRGREKSRPIQDIADEVRGLADNGVREVMLLGQNVSAYGLNQSAAERPEESPFADLLYEINKIDGIKRIRFTSPHPYFFNEKLINAIAELPKVCNSVHLPLQSGSDRILKKMNRRYNSEIYLDVVNKLKSRVADITFSTDLIVAFPGETEEDFKATRDIMNQVGFDNAYIFKYSPREGTPAAKQADQVPQKIKEERNQILLEDLKVRTKQHNRTLEGRTFEILTEGPSKRNPERWNGRTTNNKVTVFEPYENISTGDLVNVQIKSSTSMTLFGKVIGR